MKNVIVIVFVFFSAGLFAQMTRKMEKLVGKWSYKEGSGYEMWSKNGDALSGQAYRINVKASDSIRAEDLRIARVNKNMVYVMETYNYENDTITKRPFQFIGNNKSFKFYNVNEGSPYRIEYKFGFFNRNKLIIKIQYVSTDKKPLKLVLFRE